MLLAAFKLLKVKDWAHMGVKLLGLSRQLSLKKKRKSLC